MHADVAIIGRVLTHGGEKSEISTRYGNVKVISSTIGGRDVVFISRHGDDHVPPHRVNYRAIICAAESTGAESPRSRS